ncbi:MAG: hypothetical protein QM820_30030 [Minicystis sp.]
MGAGGLAGVLVGGLVERAESAASASALGSCLGLQVGQRFGRWTVTAVRPVGDGALHVAVKGVEEREFELELLSRDPSPLAPTPPATTEGLAIFVRNGGDGWLPTAEEQGLAAMTLADLLTKTGHGGAVEGLLTYSERFARHQETLTSEEITVVHHLV